MFKNMPMIRTTCYYLHNGNRFWLLQDFVFLALDQD